MGQSNKQWVLYKDSALKSLGDRRFDVAETSLIAALEECHNFKETDARNLLTIEKLAECYWYLGNFAQARIFCEQLVNLHEQNESLSRGNHLSFSINLSMILHVSRDLEKAEEYYKKTIKLAKKYLGTNHAYYNKIKSLYADLLMSKGDGRTAAMQQVPPKVVTVRDWVSANTLKLPQSVADDLKRTQVGVEINKQAMLLSFSQPEAEAVYTSNIESAKKAEAENRFGVADLLYQINLKILEKFGVQGQVLANAFESVATVKQKLGRTSEAVEFYQKAHAVKEKSLGESHPVIAHSFGQIANYYYQLPDYENGERMAKRCAELYEKLYGREHPEVACAIHNLATLYHVQRKYEHAEEAYKKSLAIKNKVFGPEHPETKRLMNSYAELLAQTSQATQESAGNGDKKRDSSTIPGMITGSWKVIQMNSSESLSATRADACDICGADLGGEIVCNSCGFDTSAGI